MKINKLILAGLLSGAILILTLTFSCTKNSTTPPVHDTVTVIKIDTTTILQKIDTPDIKTGLVIYLPLNGSIADSSGLNNTVTAVGGATLGYDRSGWPNSALNSTGSGTELIVTNNGSYKVDTAFSVSFDFMIRVPASYNCCGNYNSLENFVSLVDNSDAYGPTFTLGMCLPQATQNLAFGVNPSSSACNAIPSSGTTPGPDTTNFTPQVGTWYNCIAIFSHGTTSVYIDGQLVGQKSGYPTSALFCSNASFIVGAWWGQTENLNGGMDEVRFYNRTLTAKQIAWLSRNFQVNSTKQGATPANGTGSRIH